MRRGRPARALDDAKLLVVAQFESETVQSWRHPERSRFSGGARDLLPTKSEARRSLSRLKCAAFRDDAHDERCPKFKLSNYRKRLAGFYDRSQQSSSGIKSVRF